MVQNSKNQGKQKRNTSGRQAKRVVIKNPDAKRASSKRDRNIYAASLLNPSGVKDAKIPDESTIPSITLQTSSKHTVQSDSAGNFYRCIKPTVNTGMYDVRRSTAGDLKQQDAIDDIDPTWIGGDVLAILSAAQIESFTRTCAAIRPVSMSVEYIPTQAALTAQGLGGTGLYSGQSIPAAWDSANTQSGGLTDPSLIHWDNSLAPSTMSEALTSMKTEVNAMTGFTTYWGPEDEGDFEYRSLEYTALAPSGKVTYAHQSNSTTLGWNLCYYVKDNGSGGTELVRYIFPWNATPSPGYSAIGEEAFTYNNGHVDYYCGLPQIEDSDLSYPWIAVLFTGTDPSTTLGELVITINWEAIPNQSIQSVITASHSSWNPNELAQAANIVRNVPETTTRMNNDPNTKIRMAAIQSTSDLYDDRVGTKHAVEGNSFFDRVKKFASKIDWSLVASAGKALLSML